jgi:hypothetical protein
LISIRRVVAGGVKKQRLEPCRCVVAADLVTLKRLSAHGCVSETSGVILEREGTVGRVCIGVVVHKRAEAGRRGEATDGVVKERISPDSGIALSGGVVKEGESAVGCVAGADSIAQKGPGASGRI